ncbi:hypothetical protein IKQ02_03810 [bacterium]|nr:hypothetical protein [bacterium]
MEMTIKEIFEKENITISKFALDFSLSRNTTMQYIELFERGEKIPKEKYNYIFDRLFTNYDSNLFEADYYCFKNLVNRDRLNGTLELSMEKTDLIMRSFRKLSNATKNDTIDTSALFLIDTIISNYSKDDIFKSLCDYFYFFNNSKTDDYKTLSEEEKTIYTNYFKIFTMQKQNLLKLDPVVEKLFLSRINEINQLKNLSK